MPQAPHLGDWLQVEVMLPASPSPHTPGLPERPSARRGSLCESGLASLFGSWGSDSLSGLPCKCPTPSQVWKVDQSEELQPWLQPPSLRRGLLWLGTTPGSGLPPSCLHGQCSLQGPAVAHLWQTSGPDFIPCAQSCSSRVCSWKPGFLSPQGSRKQHRHCPPSRPSYLPDFNLLE